ncbi:MAG: 3-hydroxyacyl-ACP dehydratase FabZ [Nitrospinota bacterium]
MEPMTQAEIDAGTSNRLISLLPHRHPFLLVDRIVQYEPGKRIVSIKNVTRTEPFFPGHFPDNPIMPGVLMLEAMVQTAGVLVLGSLADPKEFVPVLTRVEKVRFRKPVCPGDQMVMEAQILRSRHPVWWFSGRGFLNGELAAEGQGQATMAKRMF